MPAVPAGARLSAAAGFRPLNASAKTPRPPALVADVAAPGRVPFNAVFAAL